MGSMEHELGKCHGLHKRISVEFPGENPQWLLSGPWAQKSMESEGPMGHERWGLWGPWVWAQDPGSPLWAADLSKSTSWKTVMCHAEMWCPITIFRGSKTARHMPLRKLSAHSHLCSGLCMGG
jgi:hypothetical protein